MNDAELILNPATNRYVKKTSQTGKRLIKSLNTPSVPIVAEIKPIQQIQPAEIQPIQTIQPAEIKPIQQIQPVQTALIDAGVEIVAQNAQKFKGLTANETDVLFKKLLLERLSIVPSKSKPSKPKKENPPPKIPCRRIRQ